MSLQHKNRLKDLKALKANGKISKGQEIEMNDIEKYLSSLKTNTTKTKKRI